MMVKEVTLPGVWANQKFTKRMKFNNTDPNSSGKCTCGGEASSHKGRERPCRHSVAEGRIAVRAGAEHA